MTNVFFKRLNETAILPARATPQAVGMDLYSTETLSLAPGAFHAFSTGFAIEIPRGFEGQVRSRSGLAAKFGVCVLNSPGTIDPDYRGELKVILINHGPGTFDVKAGERIAQLVLAPVTYADAEEHEQLSEVLTRGTGGFGSTGR